MIKDFELGPPIDEALTVWRYMDFPSFYSILLSKALFFRRIDKYTDEHEGSLPNDVYEMLHKQWSSMPLLGPETSLGMLESFSSKLKQFNSGTLSNSWVQHSMESYAMWKIYLRGSSEGVAIKTTVGNLKRSFDENENMFTIAKVSYESYNWNESSYKTLSAFKYPHYSYESELRVLLYNQFEEGSILDSVFLKIPLYEDGALFSINTEVLIEQIYVSPFAGIWFNDVIKHTVKTFLPSFKDENLLTSKIKDR